MQKKTINSNEIRCCCPHLKLNFIHNQLISLIIIKVIFVMNILSCNFFKCLYVNNELFWEIFIKTRIYDKLTIVKQIDQQEL